MATLTDTNILLRLLQPRHPHCQIAERVLDLLRARNEVLNKQLYTHTKKRSQLLGMSFTDGPFAADYFRSNSFRPKNSSQVFLSKTSGLHQVMQYLYRSSL